MAATLILLLLNWFTANDMYLKTAVVFLVFTMVAPILFRPFAYVWFGLAHALGNLASRILLAIVFTLVVLPVGLLRKLSGKDSLKLKYWKKGKGSVFHSRNHSYSSIDIEKPY